MTSPFQGRSVIVTGATGFVGSRLAAALAAAGASVHAIVRSVPSSAGEELSFHRYDGTFESVSAAVREAAPEYCFHLASRFKAVHVTADVDPLIDANIRFGTHLLEALATVSSRPLNEVTFINAGTAWQHRGGAAYSPVSLYAATKQAFQDILDHFANQGLRRVTLKLFDTYGPGDERPKLLSLLIRQMEKSEPLAMTAGEQLIDLLHVDDAVAAFLAAPASAHSGTPAPAYSLASGSALSIRDLVALIARLAGRPMDVTWGAAPYRKFEMFEPWDAGERLPGWEPRISLEEGIADLVRTAGR